MDWEFGISRCKLVYTERINTNILLYGKGDYIQYPVRNHNGKEKNCILFAEFPQRWLWEMWPSEDVIGVFFLCRWSKKSVLSRGMEKNKINIKTIYFYQETFPETFVTESTRSPKEPSELFGVFLPCLWTRRKGRLKGKAHLWEAYVFIEMTSHQTGFVSSLHKKALFPCFKIWGTSSHILS